MLTHSQVNSTWYEAGGPLFILLGGEGPASTVWLVIIYTSIRSRCQKEGYLRAVYDPKHSTPLTHCRLSIDTAIMVYAQTFHAMVVQIEHRFYGETHPLPDLSDESLVYLSSEQVWSSMV